MSVCSLSADFSYGKWRQAKMAWMRTEPWMTEPPRRSSMKKLAQSLRYAMPPPGLATLLRRKYLGGEAADVIKGTGPLTKWFSNSFSYTKRSLDASAVPHTALRQERRMALSFDTLSFVSRLLDGL